MTIKEFRKELENALMSDNSTAELNKLRKTEEGKEYLKNINDLDGLQQNKYHKYDVLNHTLKVIENSPKNLAVRFAALLHDSGKYKTQELKNGEISFHGHEKVSKRIAEKLLNVLEYDSNFIERIKSLVGSHMLLKYAGDDAKIKDKHLLKFKAEHADYINDLLDLMHADNVSHGTKHDMDNQITIIKNRLPGIKKKQHEKLPLSGNDIMDEFGVKGKLVGNYIIKLKEYFDKNPNLSKQDYIDYLKTIKISENRYVLNFTEFINETL